MTHEHKFIALSQWSIDTNTVTVVAACRACGLRAVKPVFIEERDEELVVAAGIRIVEAAEAAVLEHAAAALVSRGVKIGA